MLLCVLWQCFLFWYCVLLGSVYKFVTVYIGGSYNLFVIVCFGEVITGLVLGVVGQ